MLIAMPEVYEEGDAQRGRLLDDEAVARDGIGRLDTAALHEQRADLQPRRVQRATDLLQ
jgi:hypothetical protein